MFPYRDCRKILGVILLAIVSVACTRNEPLTATQTGSTLGDKTQMFRPVTDIPIPKDAELDSERSLILSRRDDWTGRVVMITSIGAAEAYAFFQAEMPRFEWVPIMSVQSATSVLTYRRADRAATVQIERRTLGGTQVIITVARSDESVTAQPTPINPGSGR